jgi:hypothetical protein
MSGQVTITPGSGVAATYDPTGGTASGELTGTLDVDPIPDELTATTDADGAAACRELGDAHADTPITTASTTTDGTAGRIDRPPTGVDA